jgi:hypothetical protein
MTTIELPNNTLQSDIGMTPRSPEVVFLSHRLLRTDPSASYYCQPVTRIAQGISWEPVILPLLERLSELRSLPETERWPRADWPNNEAFGDAGNFTERLPVPLKSRPHISLADDGEVNFAWSHEGTRIDLGFYGTGRFSYYARDKNGDEWFGDDIPVTSPLPRELRSLLAV